MEWTCVQSTERGVGCVWRQQCSGGESERQDQEVKQGPDQESSGPCQVIRFIFRHLQYYQWKPGNIWNVQEIKHCGQVWVLAMGPAFPWSFQPEPQMTVIKGMGGLQTALVEPPHSWKCSRYSLQITKVKVAPALVGKADKSTRYC